MLDAVRERKTFTFCLAALLMASSLSACGLVGHNETTSNRGIFTFGNNGEREADLAVIAYTQGDFAKADDHVVESLRDNKKNAQALLVGALLSEKTNRPNRARQFYEEILLYNGNEVSVLGTTTPEPQKITDIARKRLRQLNLSQNKLIIEDDQGNKVFNISNEASAKNGTAAITKGLSVQQNRTGSKTTTATKINNNEIGTLFSDDEKNTIARFIIFKDLAEDDLITKEEFLRGRQANIGGLLPLTHAPASTQVIKPVPSADIIIDRINVLKSAVEDRAITGKEFAAERNLIIEAVLPPKPVQRLKKKAPSRNIIDAAKDLRKLEVLYNLNLITSGEKEKETEVIEHALGLKETTDEQYMITPTSIAVQPQPVVSVEQPIINEPAVVEIVEAPVTPQMPTVTSNDTTPANKPTIESKPLLPDVSSPFK